MLLSLSGLHVETCSGYDVVSHSVMPYHDPLFSSNV